MANAPLDFEIIGASLQAVRFKLQPGQVLIGEAGSMLFMDDGIMFECKLGDGATYQQAETQSWWGAIKAGFQRVITNESLFFTWFTNASPIVRTMAIAAPHCGTIVSVELNELPERTIIAQGGAFLCASQGVRLSVELLKKLGAGFFGGEGFLLQKLESEQGSAGQVFIHGSGYIVRRELKNEEILIDCGSLMAFTRGVQYDVDIAGARNFLISGTPFLASLRGTGSVWIQSMPFNKFATKVIMAIPTESDN